MTKIWIEYLRVIAIIAVVSIHVSGGTYYEFGNIEQYDWWVANILNTISRFSVPMFIMISGCVLLGKNIEVKSFYTKKLSRLIPPFIFWSIAYAIFDCLRHDRSFSDFLSIISSGLFITGNTYYHLWYLPMFACLMLFVPFLNLCVLGKKIAYQEFVFLFVILSFFMLMKQISTVAGEVFDLNMSWFETFPWYIGYFLLGYFIDLYCEKISISNRVTILTITVILLISSVLNFYSASSLNVLQDFFILNNTGIFNFILTVSIFYLFVNNRQLFLDNKVISSIATMSFGIYLIHPFILVILRKIISLFVNNAFISLPLLLISTLITSYFIISILSKIKFIKSVC